jgi:hypothetical protein
MVVHSASQNIFLLPPPVPHKSNGALAFYGACVQAVLKPFPSIPSWGWLPGASSNVYVLPPLHYASCFVVDPGHTDLSRMQLRVDLIQVQLDHDLLRPLAFGRQRAQGFFSLMTFQKTTKSEPTELTLHLQPNTI